MQIFKQKNHLTYYRKNLPKNITVGFVPTMGALHTGHLTLIKSSNNLCDITICSIFVNPTQFNNQHDFDNYPIDIENDIKKLKKEKCDIVYIPEAEDIYAKNIRSKKFEFGRLASVMEGKYRRGHFNGVATIIEKFFTIINPTKAFFGEKDLQQLQIIKNLSWKMQNKIEIIPVKTVREINGLAKSSRNKLLSKKEKNTASVLYKSLKYCKEHKELGVEKLKKYVKEKIQDHKNIKLEYLEFVEINTLNRISKWGEENTNAICIAVYIGNVRLIDNIIL